MADVVKPIYEKHTTVRGNRRTTRYRAAFIALAREVRRIQAERRAALEDRIELHTLLVSYGHGEEADAKLGILAGRRTDPNAYPDANEKAQRGKH